MNACLICEQSFFVNYQQTICERCQVGAKKVVSLIVNKLQNNLKSGGVRGGSGSGDNSLLDYLSNSYQVFANCLKRIKEMKDMEDEREEKLAYLGSFVDAFKEQIHTDIQVLPGNGYPIPAHRGLLATRSNIFKNMLSSDGIMAPRNDTIALPEFTYEELECLLEFLYSGQLTDEKLEKHLNSLSIAADKYEIPFLTKVCEKRLLKSLNSNNALEVLEISHACSMERAKELALNFIVKNMGEIVFSEKFDEFVHRDPHLSVEITRASCKDSKRNIK